MLPRVAAAKASRFLTDYSIQKGIYMRINHFNSDHVHALIDLPTSKTIEEVAHLLKGSSSHWINEQKLLRISHCGRESDATIDNCQPNIPRFIKRNQIRALGFFNRTAIMIDAEQSRGIQ